MNEAETRAELIDPKLKACGWGVVEGSKILREYHITPGKLQTGNGRGKKRNCRLCPGLQSRALKSPFSYYIIVDLVKHSFYQVNNLYFKFEPKR